MVVKGALTAKIDRPAGIIRFGGVKKPEEVCALPACNTCMSMRCTCKVGPLCIYFAVTMCNLGLPKADRLAKGLADVICG